VKAVATFASLTLFGLITGCGSSGSDTGTTSTIPATFSEIYDQVFPATTNPRCNFCHSMPPSNTTNGSLRMGQDKAAAYAALVGVASQSTRCDGKTLVVAGDPEHSLFFQKLSANPPCGDRMPLGGAPLSNELLDMIHSWIAAGALDD
jgi:hypothetical protein